VRGPEVGLEDSKQLTYRLTIGDTATRPQIGIKY